MNGRGTSCSSAFTWKAVLLAGVIGAVALPIGRAAGQPEGEDAQAARPAAVSYFRDVRPILQANCQGCHQPAKASGESGDDRLQEPARRRRKRHAGDRARQAGRELSHRADHARATAKRRCRRARSRWPTARSRSSAAGSKKAPKTTRRPIPRRPSTPSIRPFTAVRP